MSTLRTDRLLLRPLREDDLDDLAALDSDPEVLRFTGAFADPVSAHTYRAVLDQMTVAPTFWAAEEAGEAGEGALRFERCE